MFKFTICWANSTLATTWFTLRLLVHIEQTFFLCCGKRLKDTKVKPQFSKKNT